MANNRSLLTSYARSYTVENMYFSPASIVSGYHNLPDTIYCFLASIDPWTDNENPPVPTQDERYLKSVLKKIFAVKRLYSSDISPVAERIDWTANTTYIHYQDNVDMLEKDTEGKLVNKFYVRNQYDQIFKCLWNANSSPSTSEPYFRPGFFTDNGIFQGDDNYKWKYIYTIDSATKLKFFDNDWIPIKVTKNIGNPLKSTYGYGAVEVINVLTGGQGYAVPLTVNIIGDGYGANAVATISGNTISDITITNPGYNYTFANVSITSASGVGFVGESPVSPLGGHGYDPVSELGVSNLMISPRFKFSENGQLYTDITYYQIGILVNPSSNSNGEDYNANSDFYNVTTKLTLSSAIDYGYNVGEVVYQGATLEDATFYGTVIKFEDTLLTLINTTGAIDTSSLITGNESGTQRLVFSYSEPDFIPVSGYPIFLQNRTGIQRSIDGIDHFKIIIGY